MDRKMDEVLRTLDNISEARRTRWQVTRAYIAKFPRHHFLGLVALAAFALGVGVIFFLGFMLGMGYPAVFWLRVVLWGLAVSLIILGSLGAWIYLLRLQVALHEAAMTDQKKPS